MMNATAPRPITATSAPNPGDLVAVVVGTAVVGTGVATVVGAAVVTATVVGATVTGAASRTLNSAVPVAWVLPGRPTEVAVTRYSSGLNVDASTSNDHVFRPLVPVPAWTCTVPVAPLNAPLSVFWVGVNDDE